jgi:hypothetical protein
VGPHLFEASIVPYRGGFVGSARKLVGSTGMNPGPHDLAVVNWWRTDDPFHPTPPALIQPPDQANWHPTGIFLGADGGVKRLGGCPDRSPYRAGRDPGYIVSIDPNKNFAVTACHVVLDSANAGLPFEPRPYIDMLKLMPHTGGRDQALLHRIWSPNTPDPARRAKGAREVTQAERDATGIYWAKVRYTEDLPPRWSFAPQRA